MADSVISGKGRAATGAVGESVGISLAKAVFWRRLLTKTARLSAGETASGLPGCCGSFRGGLEEARTGGLIHRRTVST